MKLTLLDQALDLAAGSIPVALATELSSGRQALVTATLQDGDLGPNTGGRWLLGLAWAIGSGPLANPMGLRLEP